MNIWESKMGHDLARMFERELPKLNQNLERIANALEQQAKPKPLFPDLSELNNDPLKDMLKNIGYFDKGEDEDK